MRHEIRDAVRETRSLIREMRKTGVPEAVLAGAQGLDEKLTYFDTLDTQLQSALDTTRTHVQAAGLPQEILDRQARAEMRHDDGFRQLKTELQEAARLGRELDQAARLGSSEEHAAAQDALLTALTTLEDRLADMTGEETRTPLDPDRLPYRPADPTPAEPRLDAADFAELRAEVETLTPTQQLRGTAPVLSMEAAAALPGPEDLAETLEIRFTPEITAQAASLGNDPLRIFDFVRNEIELTPTRGSIQGADSCLSTRLCNATDTASLLIAMLRVSGFPARYATGTVETPVDQVMSLLGGFTDARAALDFMASSGTPVAGVIDASGELVSARFEHVWVEAFLDYIPSRGAVTGGSGDTWVPLDPSFKRTETIAGIDPVAATGFDSEAFLRDLFAATTVDETTGAVTSVDAALVDQTIAQLTDELLAFQDAQGVPATVLDMAGGSTIVPRELSLLPGSLPYEVLVRGAQFSEVPSSQRHGLRFEVVSGRFSVTPDLTFSASLPELAGRRITLSYDPATQTDLETLQSFAPTGEEVTLADFPTSLPAYLVQVRPVLRVDGEVVATGAAVTLGEQGRFRMLFSAPGRGGTTVDNALTAGTYNAIVLNLSVAEDSEDRRARALDLQARIADGTADDVTKDDFLGEYLHATGILYWSSLELFSEILAGSRGIASARLPSEGIFTYDLQVLSLFGSPREVRSGAVVTDVDTSVLAVGELGGDRQAVIDYFALTGAHSSRMESAIWDHALNPTPTGAGINTMSYLEAAARQNIPIYEVNRDNVDQVVPLLQVSSAVKTDVRNAVNAGKRVTIPEREFSKDGFQGVGYVVFDPETGAAGYLISSGLAGGGFQLPTISPGASALLGVLLAAIGGFAAIGAAAGIGILGIVAVVAAVASILLAVYDAVSNYQAIVRDNPNLGPEGRRAVAITLGMSALVSVGLSLASLIPGGGAAVAALWAIRSMWWSVNAMIISAIAAQLGRLFDVVNSRLLARVARVLRQWLEPFRSPSWLAPVRPVGMTA